VPRRDRATCIYPRHGTGSLFDLSGRKTNTTVRLKLWLVEDAFDLHVMIIHRIYEQQVKLV
jgi:hypothetical protein